MGITVAGGRGQGAAYTQISTSYALYVDARSNVYVSDCGNHRIHFWAVGNSTAGNMVRIVRYIYIYSQKDSSYCTILSDLIEFGVGLIRLGFYRICLL